MQKKKAGEKGRGWNLCARNVELGKMGGVESRCKKNEALWKEGDGANVRGVGVAKPPLP